jgi:hypothetical protein
MTPRASLLAAAAAALLGACAGALLDRFAPEPSADVARGSEEAFASGLQRRELSGQPRVPLRWTTGRAVIRFAHLPRGSRVLEVACHGHREAVAVVAEGVILGVLPPTAREASFVLPPSATATLQVELRTEPFLAGDGRRLGALLDRVTLRTARQGGPVPLLLLIFGMPAAILALCGAACGLGGAAAFATAAAGTAAQAFLLWPCGLLRSPYATTLGLLIAGTGLVALGFASWRGRRAPAAARFAFVALLVALLVQGIVASTPLMVVSDAVFHANTLGAVARGNLFPVSETQHHPPFKFPYGVSFYALLAPAYRAGLDGVGLVRFGAATSGVVGSAGLFLLLETVSLPLATLAVVLLQLLPGTFDIYSYGNLSNVFGQATTLLFLAWWLRPVGGGLVGGLLLAITGLAHLSSLIVGGTLALCLLLLWRGRPLGRARLAALVLAAVIVVGYYARFVPLVIEQLPRLREGGGAGSVRMGLAAVLWRQVQNAVGQWGLPALLLALAGVPRPSRSDAERLLAALWLSGALLLAVAVVSPLEVRFIYALTAGVACAAASGTRQLASRGIAGRLAAVVLLAAQAWVAGSTIAEAVVSRYRP